MSKKIRSHRHGLIPTYSPTRKRPKWAGFIFLSLGHLATSYTCYHDELLLLYLTVDQGDILFLAALDRPPT